MRVVDTEIDGRMYVVSVPDEEVELYYNRGMIVGPPNLSSLNLPEEVEARLHQELFARRILTNKDAMRRRSEIFSALQAAYAVDTEKILECYSNG